MAGLNGLVPRRLAGLLRFGIAHYPRPRETRRAVGQRRAESELNPRRTNGIGRRRRFHEDLRYAPASDLERRGDVARVEPMLHLPRVSSRLPSKVNGERAP